MPGCARSPKLNGFDWVLERLAADLPVRREDIVRMGAGGLLKEIPAPAPQPRERAAESSSASARMPRIAALLLAAGQSRRMGAVNKLLADIDGAPMVRRVAEALAASKTWGPTLAVTGHEAVRVREALAGLDVTFVHNADYADGLSASLRRGSPPWPHPNVARTANTMARWCASATCRISRRPISTASSPPSTPAKAAP